MRPELSARSEGILGDRENKVITRNLASRAVCSFDLTFKVFTSRIPSMLSVARWRCPHDHFLDKVPYACIEVRVDMSMHLKGRER